MYEGEAFRIKEAKGNAVRFFFLNFLLILKKECNDFLLKTFFVFFFIF